MHRCLGLAREGAGYVAPNPMVGAVLVHGERIIGEGYHRQYGGPHAEVNCIRSVKEEDRPLIAASTMYVSLEPCAHFGKTPPCADLIVAQKIPRVVIGCRDPFVEVDGKGIEKLEAGGVAVTPGVLEQACRELNKRFFTFHSRHRPYIVLKWAQTANGKIAGGPGDRLHISNALSNRLVHRWRSEEAAILVGSRTALLDNPSLTNRLWSGPSPIRLVTDRDLRLPSSLQLFREKGPTIVFNEKKHTLPDGAFSPKTDDATVDFYQVTGDVSLVQQIAHALYQLRIQSVLVEGGAQLLQSFLDEGCWDEIRVITNRSLLVEQGLPAPVLPVAVPAGEEHFGEDRIRYFVHPGHL